MVEIFILYVFDIWSDIMYWKGKFVRWYKIFFVCYLENGFLFLDDKGSSYLEIGGCV